MTSKEGTAAHAASSSPSPAAAQQQQHQTPAEAYSQLVKKHRAAQDYRRQAAAQALTELHETTDRTVTTLVSQSSDRACAAGLLEKERAADDGIKELQHVSAQTQQRLAQWGSMFVAFQNSLKDLGDLANWSAAVESDVKDAVAILETVVKAKAQMVSGGGKS